jgi:hypothetical protein
MTKALLQNVINNERSSLSHEFLELYKKIVDRSFRVFFGFSGHYRTQKGRGGEGSKASREPRDKVQTETKLVITD